MIPVSPFTARAHHSNGHHQASCTGQGVQHSSPNRRNKWAVVMRTPWKAIYGCVLVYPQSSTQSTAENTLVLQGKISQFLHEARQFQTYGPYCCHFCSPREAVTPAHFPLQLGLWVTPSIYYWQHSIRDLGLDRPWLKSLFLHFEFVWPWASKSLNLFEPVSLGKIGNSTFPKRLF